ncbi:MAG: tetratricopeptide repeat protein [Isosphaeraceae bacterium]
MVSDMYVRLIEWPTEKELSAICLGGVAVLVLAALLLSVGWARVFAKILGVLGVLAIMAALYIALEQKTVERISPMVTATRPRLPEEVRSQIRIALFGLPTIAALVMTAVQMVSWKRRLLTVPGHLREGLRLYHARDYDASLSQYDKALAIAPERAEAYFQRGRVHEAKGDIERALTDFDRAISSDPRLVAAYLHRGKLRNDRGDLDGALADFERADILRPNNPEVYLNRGVCFQKLGILRGARADFERVLNLTNHSDFAEPAKRHLAELATMVEPDMDATLAGNVAPSNGHAEAAGGNGSAASTAPRLPSASEPRN